MESSRTSTASTTATNVTMASISPVSTTAVPTTATTTPTSTMDKPDELVSSGEIHQMSSSQGQHGEPVAPASAHQTHHRHHPYQQQLHQQHQHKKCLHHRIFDASSTNAMSERVAALTNALLHQVTQQQQNLTQGSQIIQRPFPLQQSASSQQQQQQQSHLMRQQQQQQHIQQYQQQYPMQQMPTTIGMIPANIGGSGASGTHFTVGINNPSINSSAAAAAAAAAINSNGPIIHNQNGLVQKMNAALLAERYLLLDLVEGSTLYKCIDIKTHEELVCKVRALSSLFVFD